MTGKQAILGVAEYIVDFLIFWLVALAVHEFIHLNVLRMYGGEGYTAFTITGGAVVFTKPPSNYFMFALSGGLGIVAIYGLLAFWNWKDRDMEEFASILPFIGSQLAYGIFEGLFVFTMPRRLFNEYGGYISTAGFVFGLAISLWIMANLLVDNLVEKEQTT